MLLWFLLSASASVSLFLCCWFLTVVVVVVADVVVVDVVCSLWPSVLLTLSLFV